MFRNKEIQQFAIVLAIITITSAIIGFSIRTSAGILIIITAAAFGAAFFIFTGIRYRRLAKLANQIDLILHYDDQLSIAELDEGELSILQTEITKMTLRIREQNEALRKEKLHLAESLADIAHQLRTPLTSANLILSLLKKNPPEQERRSLLRENAELFAQMDWLVTSLLKLSRLDAGVVEFQMEQFNVRKWLEQAVRPLLISAELHDITLKMNISEEIVLRADSAWLSEVIRNLLKNCMESTGDHGMIEITCEDNPLYTEISVHDNGAGFETKDLSHVFDRFYRGKTSAATGYGIGLALCKSIITRQGGSIIARNHSKGGAVFFIRFPK